MEIQPKGFVPPTAPTNEAKFLVGRSAKREAATAPTPPRIREPESYRSLLNLLNLREGFRAFAKTLHDDILAEERGEKVFGSPRFQLEELQKEYKYSFRIDPPTDYTTKKVEEIPRGNRRRIQLLATMQESGLNASQAATQLGFKPLEKSDASGRQLYIDENGSIYRLNDWELEWKESPPNRLAAATSSAQANNKMSEASNLRSADGRLSVTKVEDGVLEILNQESGFKYRIPVAKGPTLVSFSPNGKQLWVGDWNGRVAAYIPETGEILKTFQKSGMRLVGIDFGNSRPGQASLVLDFGTHRMLYSKSTLEFAFVQHVGKFWRPHCDPKKFREVLLKELLNQE
jgi:hypothetical protein